MNFGKGPQANYFLPSVIKGAGRVVVRVFRIGLVKTENNMFGQRAYEFKNLHLGIIRARGVVGTGKKYQFCLIRDRFPHFVEIMGKSGHLYLHWFCSH